MEKRNRMQFYAKIEFALFFIGFVGILNTNLNAQEIYLIGSVNYPYINNLSESNISKIPIISTIDYGSRNLPTVKEIYTDMVGGKFGANVRLNQRRFDFFVDVGLQMDLLRFKRVNQLVFHDSTVMMDYNNGNQTFFKPNQFSSAGKTSIVYIEIPIEVGYKFLKNKLIAKFGINQSFMISSRQTKVNSSGNIFEEKNGEGINNLLVGINAEVSYMVFKKFEGFISYSRYLNDTYQPENQLAGKSKINVFSFGIKYKLFDFSDRQYQNLKKH